MMKVLKAISRPVLGAMLALPLMLSLATSAFAAPTIQDEEVDLKGVVTAVDEAAGTFTMETDEDGTIVSYTVQPPEDFDLTTLEVGDETEVEGVLVDDVVVAVKVEVEEPDDEEDNEDKEDGENHFCVNSDKPHPFAATLAERYETDYELVMSYFCDDGFGFGQIMLALQTAKMTEGEASIYLDMRAAGEGWGKIWQEAELIGKPEHAGPPEWAGPPDHAGPPEDRGRPEGGGPPPWAGPPEGKGPPSNR